MEADNFEQEQEQEHEVYGAEIPFETEGDDAEASAKAENQSNSTAEELEKTKKKLKEIEQEASKLRAKYQKGVASTSEANEIPAGASVDLAEKEEVDSRSIYIGNVDYGCSPEEVQEHFLSCGTINRVTILTDNFGCPKGFAYVEFVEPEAVANALLRNETELHGRTLKVLPKRTNLPGMKQQRGRPFRRPFVPDQVFNGSYGYGRVPRYRHQMRYSPY